MTTPEPREYPLAPPFSNSSVEAERKAELARAAGASDHARHLYWVASYLRDLREACAALRARGSVRVVAVADGIASCLTSLAGHAYQAGRAEAAAKADPAAFDRALQGLRRVES